MITRAIFWVFCAAFPALSAAEARWHKGNTHTHSLWSDGDDFPEMISDWYRQQGYDFLVMSDHNALARGEKWVKEAVIEKKKISLGVTALEKYRRRFSDEWVQTRQGEDGKTEVRLKTLEEYRKKLEEPGKFLLIEAEEISAAMGKAPIHINAINLTEAIQPVKDLAAVREVMRANLQLVAEQAAKAGKPMIAHIILCLHRRGAGGRLF
jgi:predicted metal-dependent phosphoesterase TrpH